MKSRRWHTLLVGILVALLANQVFSDETSADSLETEFVDGGRITIELSAGGHTISASPDNFIRVHWRRRDSSKVVDARANVDGTTAKVKIDGPSNNFHTDIQVPRNSDLVVSLTAGELEVGNVNGSKEIRLRAGELNIEVANPQDYAHIDGSVWAGDINAGPLGTQTSGLFRSIEWQGEGKHAISFRVYAGEVNIREGASE